MLGVLTLSLAHAESIDGLSTSLDDFYAKKIRYQLINPNKSVCFDTSDLTEEGLAKQYLLSIGVLKAGLLQERIKYTKEPGVELIDLELFNYMSYNLDFFCEKTLSNYEKIVANAYILPSRILKSRGP